MHLPRRALVAITLVSLAMTASSCGGVAEPDGWSAPHFAGNTIYYFPSRDSLAAATLENGSTGAVQWTFPNDANADEKPLDIAAVYGDLLESNGILYFAGWEGEVYAIDAKTGRLAWTTRERLTLDGSIVAGLATNGRNLFTATTEGRLYAISLTDGTFDPTWPEDGVKVAGGIWATPVVRDELVIVATMKGEVHAFQTANGAAAWPEPYKSATGAIPELTLINDDTLFVPTLGRKVYFLNPATGTDAHPPLKTTAWVWTDPAVKDNLVYFGDFSGTLHAVDITTGAAKWSAPGDTKIKAGPAIVGDYVVVADREPAVRFFDAATGEPRGNRIQLHGGGTVRANVVTHDGAAYILTTAGKLFRADPTKLTAVEVPISGTAR